MIHRMMELSDSGVVVPRMMKKLDRGGLCFSDRWKISRGR